MLLVLIVSVDITWLRWFVAHKRSAFGFEPMGLDFGIVPTGSLFVLVGSLAMSRRGQRRAFAAGFAICGSVALATYIASCFLAADFTGRILRRLYEPTAAFTGIERIEPAADTISPADTVQLRADHVGLGPSVGPPGLDRHRGRPSLRVQGASKGFAYERSMSG